MDSVKAFLKANIWLALVALVLVVVLVQFIDPAPPKEITIATGGESGRYYELALRIESELHKEGVKLNILKTAGSAENLELLTAADGPVSIAFVQSGMEEVFDEGDVELRSLGSLFYEPIWLFYRSAAPLELLSDLAGRRVSIGIQGSGTRAVARFLMQENGLGEGEGGTRVVELNDEAAVAALRRGEIDAAFFMMSTSSATIRSLASEPGIDFLDVRRVEAYKARYPFLSSVVVSEGLLDLQVNIPSESKTVLAAAATVVVNERFHPSLTPLVLQALDSVLRDGGLLERRGEFPSAKYVGYPLTGEAQHYFKFGPPFLLRFMPFWAASLVDRLVMVVIPLMVLLIPLAKLAGPIYRWRVRYRIYRWYKFLRETDRKIVAGTIEEDLEPEREKLAKLESELASVDVPLSYSEELYHLREHVEYVTRRLRALSPSDKPTDNES